MLLRDHPLLSHNGTRSWPPIWAWTGGSENKRPQGEIGVLRHVIPTSIEPPDRCFLCIEYEGSTYLGCLLIAEASFCPQVVELLRANRNRPIAEIGSLDLLYTLKK